MVYRLSELGLVNCLNPETGNTFLFLLGVNHATPLYNHATPLYSPCFTRFLSPEYHQSISTYKNSIVGYVSIIYIYICPFYQQPGPHGKNGGVPGILLILIHLLVVEWRDPSANQQLEKGYPWAASKKTNHPFCGFIYLNCFMGVTLYPHLIMVI